VNTGIIIFLSLFLGIANAFELPIRQSFINELVDEKKDLGNAIALNASAMNISKLLGPSIAGILIAAVGEGWCFTLNALSFIPLVIVLLSLKLPLREPRFGISRSFLGELKEGVRYVVKFPPICALLLMLGVMSLLQGAYLTLMPVFVNEQYHAGPQTLGFIIGAAGVGAVCSALYLAGRQSIRGLWSHIGGALPALGVVIAVFGYVHDAYMAAVLSFLIGFSTMMQVASTNSILQIIVEEDKRGRTMSLYGTVLIGAAPLGSVIAAALTRSLGLPLTFLLGGILALMTTLIYWQVFSYLREMIRPIYIEKGIITIAQ
jgi:MFS family permease